MLSRMEKTGFIGGESRQTLIAAIRQLRFRRTSSSMGEIHGNMDGDIADSFHRALRRIEGEPLYLDAVSQAPDRTPERPAGAAFVELAIGPEGAERSDSAC